MRKKLKSLGLLSTGKGPKRRKSVIGHPNNPLESSINTFHVTDADRIEYKQAYLHGCSSNSTDRANELFIKFKSMYPHFTESQCHDAQEAVVKILEQLEASQSNQSEEGCAS